MQIEIAGISFPILRDIVVSLWPNHWKIIVIILVFILVGIISQILLLRGGGHSKLSPGFNRFVGFIAYLCILYFLASILSLILGSRITSGLWFLGFGAIIAYPLTKFVLMLIGFWYYSKALKKMPPFLLKKLPRGISAVYR